MEGRTPDGRHIYRQRTESPAEGRTPNGRRRACRRAKLSTGGGTLNRRRVSEMRTRRRAEFLMEDREADGARNTRQKTDIPMEGGTPDGRQKSCRRAERLTDNERSTEDGWIDAGLDAQQDLERSCPFLAERKEIKAGTNRRSRSDPPIRRSHRRSTSSLTFLS